MADLTEGYFERVGALGEDVRAVYWQAGPEWVEVELWLGAGHRDHGWTGHQKFGSSEYPTQCSCGDMFFPYYARRIPSARATDREVAWEIAKEIMDGIRLRRARKAAAGPDAT